MKDLWVEKYRPNTLNGYVFRDNNQRQQIESWVKEKTIPHLLFSGNAGIGKTTLAKILLNLLEINDLDVLEVNASRVNSVEDVRNKITNFVQMIPFGDFKVVLLDEADYLNPNSTQPALRAFMEEFSSNCRFIFTCNFKNRIIPPLHSRTAVVEFKLPKSEKPRIAAAFFKRVLEILKHEGVQADDKVIAKVIEKHFPDYRRILNELQRYSSSGNIDEGILVNMGEINMQELTAALKDKDWKKMRTWVVNNIDNDPQTLFRKFYDTLSDSVVQVPQLVLLLADYQYKSAFCADQEINLVACLTEIMASVEFK